MRFFLFDFLAFVFNSFVFAFFFQTLDINSTKNVNIPRMEPIPSRINTPVNGTIAKINMQLNFKENTYSKPWVHLISGHIFGWYI
jgi:hypothetical protein